MSAPYDDNGDPSCWPCWNCACDMLVTDESMDERYREVYASAHAPGGTQEAK